MNPQYLADYNGYHMDGYGWGWGLLMMLFWALVVIAVVVLLIRGLTSGHNNQASKDDDGLAIAKKRYAKGEITKKEFEQLKKDLTSK